MIHNIPLFLLALCVSSPAFAGAEKVPTYQLDTDKNLDKAAKTFGLSFEGKVKAYPKKVAIGSFQVRYGYETAGMTKDAHITVQFQDSVYEDLTGVLYDQLVAQLETDGFEVVPLEQVLSSDAFQRIEAEDAPRTKKNYSRHTPKGMKNVKLLSGKPRKPSDLIALNSALGTDAVLAVYVSYSLCETNSSPKTIKAGMPPGTHICLRSRSGNPGLSMIAYGGSREKKGKYKADWTARMFKKVTPFTYSKRGKSMETYDAAFIDHSTTATFAAKFWGGYQADVKTGVYMNGALETFADALVVGLRVWYKKTEKARKKADVATATPARDVRPFTNEARKATQSLVDAAAVAAEEGVAVPPLAGELRCYEGSSAMNGKTSGKVLLRRGITDTQVVEDSVTLIKGQPPYRYVTTLTLSDATLSATEAAGTWTGTGSWQPDWASWSTKLKMSNGMTILTDFTASEGGLQSSGEMLGADGKRVGKTSMDLTRIDAETCEKRFSKIPVTPGSF